MNNNDLFVVGAGFMGSGIVENAAQKGVDVIVYDLFAEQLDKSRRSLAAKLDKKVKAEKMSEDEKKAIINKIKYTADISECRDADIIIEAVAEKSSIKMDIMREVDKYAREDAVIASNTSSISITKLGSALKDPARFIGMHFFSPVTAMPLLEVVLGYKTSDSTTRIADEFGEKLGKNCIHAKDETGFLINRMLIPMINEAIILVERKVGTIEGIDLGMKLGLHHPMGPLELVDMIGIDVELSVMEILYAEIGDPKYRPAVSLRRMVDAGYLGRKSGIGFYIYDKDGTKRPNPIVNNIQLDKSC